MGQPKRQSVDYVVCLVAREADVLRAQLADAVSLEGPALHAVRSFAVDLPWPSLVDGLAVDLHPRGHAIEYRDFFAVDRAVRLAGNIENEGAVLADRVDQPVDDVARRQIPAVFTGLIVKRTVVVPVADAGLRLPGILHDLRW